MINFKVVRWRNVLSYGQTWTEIQLDRSPSTMILGKNGAGKSTIADAIVFGLFGKPFRKIKKGQLINTKNNRDLMVEVEFDVDGVPYVVRRGQKPDIFEVFKDGVLQNQPGANRDYQRQLEQSILRMDYQAACQIVFVGKAQHTTFMQLDSSKRRLFVEVILNLVVFSNMSKIHSAKSLDLKNKISELKSAVTVSREKVKLRQRFIEELEAADRQNQEAEIRRISDALDRVTAELDALYQSRDDLTASAENYDRAAYDDAIRKLRDNTNLLIKVESKINTVSDRLMKLNSSTSCHTCGQEISVDDHACQQQDQQAKYDELTSARDDLSNTIDQLQRSIELFEVQVQKYNDYMDRVRALDVKISISEGSRDSLNEEFTRDRISQVEKIESARRDLDELSSINKGLIEKLERLSKRSDYMSLIGSMLQDKGIKAMLIKRFIPIINHSVNNYLAQLGLFVKFNLDENFDETIQARGIDTLGYHNFSEGEKLRMDMALLMSWRDIARMQGNVATNLLIFDEIFDSSLDQGGSEALADLLGQIKDLNVFIITHTPEKIADKVRSTIQIDRIEGFSKLV